MKRSSRDQLNKIHSAHLYSIRASRHRTSRYRAKMKAKEAGLVAIIGSHTDEEWVNRKTQFKNKCGYCGRDHKLTKDHYFPVESGGVDFIWNIIPCCLSCNSSKSNCDPNHWLLWKFGDNHPMKNFIGYERGGVDG